MSVKVVYTQYYDAMEIITLRLIQMINPVRHSITTFLTAILMAMNVYGQPATHSTGSDILTPPTAKPMILCPTLTVDAKVSGVDTVTKITSSDNTIPLGDADCIDIGKVGVMAIVFSIIGGNYNFNCPADHPYVGKIKEQWGFAMVIVPVINGGADMYISCCSAPKPKIYLSNNPATDWQEGTACKY